MGPKLAPGFHPVSGDIWLQSSTLCSITVPHGCPILPCVLHMYSTEYSVESDSVPCSILQQVVKFPGLGIRSSVFRANRSFFDQK